MGRVGSLLAAIVAATLAATGPHLFEPDAPATPLAPVTPAGFPAPARVALMVLENRSYRQVIGAPGAPFLNRLARRDAVATHYFALTHPSLPNYIAMTTGAMAEVSTNCARCATDRPSLVNQLDRTGIPWRAYFESLPRNPAARVRLHGRYNKHYNPFLYTESVQGRPPDRSRVVGFRRLGRDVEERRLPRFSWIAPNMRHDGHGSSLRRADRFARKWVPALTRALGPRGVLYITWDEGRRSDRQGLGRTLGGGHVVLIAAGGAARRHARVSVPASHYALLRTIEASFRLRPLGRAGARSTPLLRGLLR